MGPKNTPKWPPADEEHCLSVLTTDIIPITTAQVFMRKY